MQFKKLKHKKIKNTGLIYEFLIRQVTSDVLKGDTPSSLNIIKKYFKGDSPLKRELHLYDILLNQKVTDPTFAIKVIESVMESNSSLDRKALAKEKYNLLKEISHKYDVNSFFRTKIVDYPTYASIYTLLEYKEQDNLEEFLQHKLNVANHLLKPDTKVKAGSKSLMEGVDPELKALTLKLMTEKFNKKWNVLNEDQKEVLRQFIFNSADSVESFAFIKKQVTLIESKVKTFINRSDDAVLKIKLQEVLNVLPRIENSTFITDKHYLTLIRYHELLSELK